MTLYNSLKTAFFFCFIFLCTNARSHDLQDGFLDISDLPLENENIELRGEMCFYWEELLNDEEIKSGHRGCTTINTENSWNNQTEGIQGHPSFGYVTYAFQLVIPERLVSKRLIIRPQHFISYASNITVDGVLCAQNGSVGKQIDDQNYIPSRATEASSFTPSTDTLSVVIQVANFHHFRGGVFKAINIGTEQNMLKARERAISLDLFIIISLMVMFLYHLILFAVNIKEITSLFFALVCLTFSWDLSLQGPMIFFLFFPEASFNFYSIMHLVVPYFIPVSFFLFIYYLFPNQVSKKITITTIVVALILFIYTLLVGVAARSYVIKPFYMYAGVLVSYLYYLCFKLLKKKAFGSQLFAFAYAIFSLCVVNDILNMFELIYTHNLMTYGIVVFVFLMSILYGRKNTALLLEASLLTQSLKNANKDLENKIKSRTKELNSSLVDLNELNAFQEGMTHIIANDLKNQLKKIINIDYKQSNDIPALRNSGLRMLNMIQNMLDVYRFNKQKVHLDKSFFNVSEPIDEIIEEFTYIAHQNALKVEVIQYETFKLNADIHIFKRVMTNFLSNAIQHSPHGGLVQIKVINGGDNNLKISINNEGSSLSQDEQQNIFGSNKTVEMIGGNSMHNYGSGLSLCKMAIELHNGQIGIDSNNKTGVSFWFTLPDVIVVRDETLKVLHNAIDTIVLEDEEKKYLAPFATKIRNFELFETSKIESILETIDKKNIPIENWCEAVQHTAYTQNELKFEEYINQVLKPL